MPLLVAFALDDRDGTGLEVVWSKQLFERDPTEGSEAPKPDTFPSSRQSTELHNSRAPALNLIVVFDLALSSMFRSLYLPPPPC